MQIKSDQIPLSEKIGKQPRENFFFYLCPLCGKVVLDRVRQRHVCAGCGRTMRRLVPLTKTAQPQDCLPVVTDKGDQLQIATASRRPDVVRAFYLEYADHMETIPVPAGKKPQIQVEKKAGLAAVYALCGSGTLAKTKYQPRRP
jgi:predicted RNA-binding Zn-ribbon protein involved in translation (DUF1610 family)